MPRLTNNTQKRFATDVVGCALRDPPVPSGTTTPSPRQPAPPPPASTAAACSSRNSPLPSVQQLLARGQPLPSTAAAWPGLAWPGLDLPSPRPPPQRQPLLPAPPSPPPLRSCGGCPLSLLSPRPCRSSRQNWRHSARHYLLHRWLHRVAVSSGRLHSLTPSRRCRRRCRRWQWRRAGYGGPLPQLSPPLRPPRLASTSRPPPSGTKGGLLQPQPILPTR